MAVTAQFAFLIMVVFILFSPATKGVRGQCSNSTPPQNQVVYEGNTSTIMTCDSPTPVSWKVTPSDTELSPSTITNYSDIVLTTPKDLTLLYSSNQTDLTIKVAQSNATVEPITTSGVYVAYWNPSDLTKRLGAELIVIRQGPTCDCTAINSTFNNITCSLTYAAPSYNPIYPVVRWYADGSLYSTSTLNTRKTVNNSYPVTSAITINASDSRSFQCRLNFTKPQNIGLNYLAMNAPNFSAICTPIFCGSTTTQRTTNPATTTTAIATTTTNSVTTTAIECVYTMKNIAVYAGQPNTIMNNSADPNNIQYKLKPTSNELSTLTLIKYGGINNYPGLFGISNTGGLIINNATVSGSPSTAGLYLAQCVNNTNMTSAKLVVVQSAPECACIPVNYASNLSCNISYADSSLDPIYPIFTWKFNGVVVQPPQTINQRVRVGPVWVVTSYLTDNNGAPGNYECDVTFAPPTELQNFAIALNAPDFIASCTTEGCSMTTSSEATTTPLPQTTTPLPETTTPLPQTTILSQTTTPLPQTTTSLPLTTTSLPLITTLLPQTTTSLPQTTTPLPQTTSPVPQTTTPLPKTTTPLPQTTTRLPKATTQVPRTTTSLPQTTTPLPQTTTPLPQTTTSLPQTTTPLPQTTTSLPQTTTPLPQTTTPLPQTTTYLPQTTTPLPQTTTALPQTIAPLPQSTTPVPQTTIPLPQTTTPLPSTETTAGYNCSETNDCSTPDQSCTTATECQSDGTNLTDIYDECVVKAELYSRCNNCSLSNLVCGIVVILRDDTRYLIYDSLSDDNKCEMVVVDTSCMSSDWKLLAERKIAISGVGDYVQSGNSVQIGDSFSDCSESCKRMMNLP